ncbi:MAG TPA: winged helix-turn-helix domain-containing protein [Usitatibacter sp.]|nr:winged helix-turn-helix domain-containing protein [Usitatibacter sp.]
MRFAFDGHLLDLDRRELRRGDACVAVEPQVLDLLAHLLRNRERVVSRDELMATVWAGRIVSDSTLDSRINAARRAVGDTGQEQRLIRTYSRKGVRFVGEASEDPGSGRGHDDERTAAPLAARGKPCLAVLPFANLSSDPDQDYFSDGITEDIITELSRNRSLLVVARNSSFAFRSGGVDVREIGRALGADYVVEGSVRRSGVSIRVTVQLAETVTGLQLWAERYDRGIDDIFEVQDQITSTIAARLEPEVDIAEQQRTARKPRHAFDAWDFFRLGSRAFYRSSAGANREAQQLFRRAIELDPELAQAYGFLSYAIVLSMIYFDAAPEAALLDEAVSIARKGVELDERDAMVRFMYGRALLARGSYGESLAELEAAREMNPSLAVVHCGLGDSLAYEGRIDEAIPHFHTAITLSPHDPFRWAFLSYRALAHLFARQFGEAAEWAQQATRIPNCHYWGFAHRVSALGHLERKGELERALRELRDANPLFSQAVARQRLFYVKRQEQVSLYLEGLRKAGVPAR